MDTDNNENLVLINFDNGVLILYNYITLTTINSIRPANKIYGKLFNNSLYYIL